jgi:predicted lipid-binding transport protein (Tim44 family)
MNCPSCGQSVEAGAVVCRRCGATLNASPARPDWQERLRRAYPRHNLQDDLMHAGQLLAGLMAVGGLVLGVFFLPVVGLLFITFAIALLLQLLLRERTLEEIRRRGPGARYHAKREQTGATRSPAAAAPPTEAPPPPPPA